MSQYKLPVGDVIEKGIDFLVEHLSFITKASAEVVETVLGAMESGLLLVPTPVFIVFAGLGVWFLTKDRKLTVGSVLGLAHGHQAKTPAGIIPWWKNQKHDGKLMCDVLLTGHFHYPSFRPSGRDPVTGKSSYHIQASTLDNGSSWVANTMGEDGDPGLTVFVIDDDGFDQSSFALL